MGPTPTKTIRKATSISDVAFLHPPLCQNKLDFFDKEHPSGSFSIAVFIETHHRDFDDLPEKLREYGPTHDLLYHSPAPRDHAHRIMFHKDFEVLSWLVRIPGRLVNIKYTTSC